MIRPVLAEIAGSWPSLFNFAQMSAVRRSCQTMARCTACPVARSHTTVVSRWLVMPIAAMSFAFRPAFFQRLAADRDGRGPDVLRLVLDPARGRKMLREFLLRRGGDGDIAAKHDGARGRGALIDGQHKGHERCFPGGLLVAQEASGLGGEGQDWINAAVASSSPGGGKAAHEARGRGGDGFGESSSKRVHMERHPAPVYAATQASHPPPQGRGKKATSPPSSRRRRRRWSGRS